MYRMNWGWAITTVALAAATGMVVALDIVTPLRPWITLAFLLICPGMAYIRLLELDDPLAEVVLAVALSLVLELGVAAISVYGGFWALGRVLLIVTGLSIVGVLGQLWLWYRGRTDGRHPGQLAQRPLEHV